VQINASEIVSRLQPLFKGEIAKTAEVLEKYSRDASIFKIIPQIVVFPKDVEDISNLVKLVGALKSEGYEISVTPRAAGTDMGGGPLSASIVMDMTRHFNRILEIGADFAIVEPGVYFRDLEKEISSRRLMFPSYPASRELCTVGGMVANNAGGEKTLLYGKTDRYVEELHVILADGKEYLIRPRLGGELHNDDSWLGAVSREILDMVRDNADLLAKARPQVSKNSSGYALWDVFDKERGVFDLTKLFTGSQGTLGVITKIKFKILKTKPASRMLVIFLKNLKNVGDIVNVLRPFGLESLESYDDHTIKVAIKFLPQLVKRLKGNIFSLLWRFIPEAWMVITGGMPKLVLLAEFTAETDAASLFKAKAAREALRGFGLRIKMTRNKKDEEKYWLIRRESFNMLRQKLGVLHTAPFIDDFVVPPETLPSFLPELERILGRFDLIYTIAGHVGDGNFHIIPLMDLNDQKNKDIIKILSEEVYRLVLAYGGSITGEHNDGIVRTPYVRDMFGAEVYGLFVKTKQIFDPQNIFNPGKKVAGTWEYALAHISAF